MISTSASNHQCDLTTIAGNLRRLMAGNGMNFVDLVEATGLDERTIRGVVRGANQPHARTLHKLAQGLGVEIDELFRPLGHRSPRQFDRATNALVEAVAAAHPLLFECWSQADFDELYSRFGTGGQLTEAGVRAAAEIMNAHRDLWRQIAVVLESGEAELLADFVRFLFQRATRTPSHPE